jgi:protein SCO1/2
VKIRALAVAALSLVTVWADTQIPPQLREVGIDQRLDAQLPLDLVFRDEEGRPVALRRYFTGRPVILTLVYYECPMLCNLILNGVLRTIRVVSFDLGRDYAIVTVSIDPREKPSLAAVKKRKYASGYGRPGAAAGWHFLTGDEAAIRELARAAGFRYAWDPAREQYAHAAGFMVATPQGRLARYFYGVEYSARDLRLALVEASAGRIGSAVDQILLYCFHYDPQTGKYGPVVLNVVRAAGLATLLALGWFLFVMFRRERRHLHVD